MPKALIEVAGRPFLDWKLDELIDNGVTEAILLIGHGGEQIQDHLDQRPTDGLTLRCLVDGDRLLGTAGAIARVIDALPEHFWVTYGDTLLEADMRQVERAWRESTCRAAMTVVHNQDREQTSNTTLRSGRVAEYSKVDAAGTHEWLDYGLLILPRESFRQLTPGSPADLALPLSGLVAAEELAGIEVNGWFHDIGTPDALARTAAWCRARRSD